MGELETANRSYDAAIALTADAAGRHRIESRRHRPGVVRRDGAQIAYYLHGSGDETLLFVNPVVYGLEVFQPIVERLCQEFRIITIDPRGTGASDPLQRPYGLGQHIEDVRAVIERTGHRRHHRGRHLARQQSSGSAYAQPPRARAPARSDRRADRYRRQRQPGAAPRPSQHDSRPFLPTTTSKA